MKGYISQKGNRLGIRTPVNTAITQVVDEIDRGFRDQVSNIQEVL
ncbi:MAG: hypothetical protein CM1200mP3_10850 [Chloroflexota bacterium]|nr:MAG: hypothetical protein CM1200mP3_10850 [Chloroflexota bacterium]